MFLTHHVSHTRNSKMQLFFKTGPLLEGNICPKEKHLLPTASWFEATVHVWNWSWRGRLQHISWMRRATDRAAVFHVMGVRMFWCCDDACAGTTEWVVLFKQPVFENSSWIYRGVRPLYYSVIVTHQLCVCVEKLQAHFPLTSDRKQDLHPCWLCKMGTAVIYNCLPNMKIEN